MKQSMGLQALAAVSQHAGMMEAFELLRKYNLFGDEMPLLALHAYAERSNTLEDKWSAVVEGSVASAAASAKVCLPPPHHHHHTHTHTLYYYYLCGACCAVYVQGPGEQAYQGDAGEGVANLSGAPPMVAKHPNPNPN